MTCLTLFSVHSSSTPDRPWFASGGLRHIKLAPGLYRLVRRVVSVRSTGQLDCKFGCYFGLDRNLVFFLFLLIHRRNPVLLFCCSFLFNCVLCSVLIHSFVQLSTIHSLFLFSLYLYLSLSDCVPVCLCLCSAHWPLTWPAMQIALEIVLCSVGPYTSHIAWVCLFLCIHVLYGRRSGRLSFHYQCQC